MLKKRVNLFLSFLLGIFTSALAQAQVYGSRPSAWQNVGLFGNYLDASFFGWAAIFVAFFGLLVAALGNIPLFKNNKGSKIAIGAALSFGATYGLMQSQFSLSSFLLSLGLDPDSALPIIIVGLVLLFLGILIWKYEFVRGLLHAMWVTGLVFMVASLTDLVYEQLIVFIAGAILFLLGLWLLKKKGKKNVNDPGGDPGPGSGGQNRKNRYVLTIDVNGNGVTRPKPGSYNIKEGKKVKISARPRRGYQFKYFTINGKKDTRRKIKFRMNGNYNVVANFAGNGGGSGPNNGGGGQGPDSGEKKKQGRMEVSVKSLSFNKKSTKKTIEIRNLGGSQKLQWYARVWPRSWLKVSKRKGTISPNGREKITVYFYPKKYLNSKTKRKQGAVQIRRGKGRQDQFTVGVYPNVRK